MEESDIFYSNITLFQVYKSVKIQKEDHELLQ